MCFADNDSTAPASASTVRSSHETLYNNQEDELTSFSRKRRLYADDPVAELSRTCYVKLMPHSSGQIVAKFEYHQVCNHESFALSDFSS